MESEEGEKEEKRENDVEVRRDIRDFRFWEPESE